MTQIIFKIKKFSRREIDEITWKLSDLKLNFLCKLFRNRTWLNWMYWKLEWPFKLNYRSVQSPNTNKIAIVVQEDQINNENNITYTLNSIQKKKKKKTQK